MNGNKSFLHAEGLKLCTWLVVGQLCFKVSWSYLPISSYFRGIALTNKTKKKSAAFNLEFSNESIYNSQNEGNSILCFKIMFHFGNYLCLQTLQGKTK